MTDEKNYPVQAMNAETLARRRDHSQRNPWGNTAELVGHIDWLEAQLAASEARVKALEEAALYTMQINDAWDNCRFCGFSESQYGGGSGHGRNCPMRKLDEAMNSAKGASQ